MLIVRKGPTSHLPLHDNDNDDDDTIEIPPTEILGRIFNVSRVRTPCTHPAVYYLWKTKSTWENPDPKRRIWRGSVTISKT
jgi:hypothetical protein